MIKDFNRELEAVPDDMYVLDVAAMTQAPFPYLPTSPSTATFSTTPDHPISAGNGWLPGVCMVACCLGKA